MTGPNSRLAGDNRAARGPVPGTAEFARPSRSGTQWIVVPGDKRAAEAIVEGELEDKLIRPLLEHG